MSELYGAASSGVAFALRRPRASLLVALVVAAGLGLPAGMLAAVGTEAVRLLPSGAASTYRLVRADAGQDQRFVTPLLFQHARQAFGSGEVAAFSRRRGMLECQGRLLDVGLLEASSSLAAVVGVPLAPADRQAVDDGRTALVSAAFAARTGCAARPGGTLRINGERYVVGARSPSMGRAFEHDVWIGIRPPEDGAGDGRYLALVARADAPVTPARLAEVLQSATGAEGWRAVPLWRDVLGPAADVIDLARVVVVLAACAAFVTIGILGHMAALARRHELVTMRLLGASSSWLVFSAVAASSVGHVVGTAGAIWTAVLSAGVALRWLGDAAPAAVSSVWPATLAACAAAWLVHPFVAWRATRETARDASMPWPAVRRRRLFAANVAVVACAAVLVAATVATVSRARQAASVPLGFDPEGVTYRSLRLPADATGRSTDIEAVLTRAASTAGTMVGLATSVPLTGVSVTTTMRADNGMDLRVAVKAVSGGYFDVMRIPFAAGSYPPDAWQVVVSQQAAGRWWPTASAIGRSVRFGGLPLAVGGVVADTIDDPATLVAVPTVYIPLEAFQPTSLWAVTRDLARANGKAATLDAAESVAAVGEPRAVGDLIADALAPRRLAAGLLMIAAAFATLVAALAVYATTATRLRVERHGLAIRAALGATAPRLAWLNAQPLAVASAVGLGLSVPAMFAGARWLPGALTLSARDVLFAHALVIAIVGTAWAVAVFAYRRWGRQRLGDLADW